MEQVLTAQQAAKALGYNIDHFYRLLKAGTVEGRRFGRVWMIDRAEIRRVKALQDENGRLRQDQR